MSTVDRIDSEYLHRLARDKSAAGRLALAETISVLTPSQTVHRREASDVPNASDLVSSVSVLADCMERANVQAAGGGVFALRETARNALVAVLDAERRMVQQRDRIMYLERLTMTDELTGLLNRRGFQAQLRRALAAANRYEERGLLAYVDLDGFKPVNDTYGHAAGDEVLRQVARVLNDNVRDTDCVGRLGGDEFAILLTRTSPKDGVKRARWLEELVNNTVVDWQGRSITLRASFGFQRYGPKDDELELLKRADSAMYDTKRRRGDRTVHRISA